MWTRQEACKKENCQLEKKLIVILLLFLSSCSPDKLATQWLSSLEDAPAPISYVLADFTELITDYAKRSAVQQAVAAYVAEQQVRSNRSKDDIDEEEWRIRHKDGARGRKRYNGFLLLLLIPFFFYFYLLRLCGQTLTPVLPVSGAHVPNPTNTALARTHTS